MAYCGSGTLALYYYCKSIAITFASRLEEESHVRRMSLTLSLFLIAAALIVGSCGKSFGPAGGPAAPTAVPGSTSTPAGKPAGRTGMARPTLTLYSGREEKLIGPLIARFQERTGIEVKVRYGDTAELAATILEEGNSSPADVYLAQDAGALGALTRAQRLARLPGTSLDRVDPRYRAPGGEWVGISGRARTVVYNTKTLKEEDLPDSLLGFTDPRWKGKIGWAPTNGSFQSFVTALRVTAGDEAAQKWLEGIQANAPKIYKNNMAIVTAVGTGEIEVGFVNHYYLFRAIEEQGDSYPVRNYHPRVGDAGAMVNVAGIGILTTAKNTGAAESLVEYLLSPEAQQYFADETFEYPLIEGIKTHPLLTPLDRINSPRMDLGSLADLEKTLRLLQTAGVL